LGSSTFRILSKAVLCPVIAIGFPLSGDAVLYSFASGETSAGGESMGLDWLERPRFEGSSYLKLANTDPGASGFSFKQTNAVEVTNEEEPAVGAGDEDSEEATTSPTGLRTTVADEDILAPESADSVLLTTASNSPSFTTLSSIGNPGQAPVFVIPPQAGQHPGLGNYVDNNPGGSFGFDPNTHYANDPVFFQGSNVSPTPEAATLLPLVGVLLMAGGLRRFRRAS
jgi:hypothetical protein